MMTHPEISTVLFDFGDTLWHFPEPTPPESVVRETSARVAAALQVQGHEPSGAATAFGPALRARLEQAERDADQGELRSPDYVGLAQQAARRSGLEIARDDAEALWRAYNLGGPFLGRRIFPKSLSTLAWLRRRGYRLGAITNRALGGQDFLEELRGHGLLDFFEVVAISADVGWRKPHPAIFRYALEAIQVTSGQCVMVGDSLREDVAGGSSLGMTTVLITGGTKPRAEETAATPNYVIDAVEKLPGLPLFAR